MNWEIEEIKVKLRQLDWQKVDSWKLDSLESNHHYLKEQIIALLNRNSWLEERVRILEEKLDKPPFNVL